MRARTLVFRVVAGRHTLLETDSLDAALSRRRRARLEGVAAEIKSFRPTQWPPPRRAVVR